MTANFDPTRPASRRHEMFLTFRSVLMNECCLSTGPGCEGRLDVATQGA